MRTSKPIATISYNTPEFLKMKLGEMIASHTISDWMFIRHQAEKDERKDHIHLWIKPNKLLDTMTLQENLMELDPTHPDKPLKCIDFRVSSPDDWILYGQHLEPYLASKGQSREYHYTKEDFVYYDEDSFEDRYLHALKGSEWAKQYQILDILQTGNIPPADLVLNGIVPLNMSSQISSLTYMRNNYGSTYGFAVNRNGRPGHDD